MADAKEIKREPEDPPSDEEEEETSSLAAADGGCGGQDAGDGGRKADEQQEHVKSSPPVTVKAEPPDEDEEGEVNGEEGNYVGDKDVPKVEVKLEEESSEEYDKLVTTGLDAKVSSRLDEIYKTGKLSPADLDDRALDALKEFPVDGALAVLSQFCDSNLEHVSNKSAYLCGVMKTYRQKTRSSASASSMLNGGVSASSLGSVASGGGGPNGSAAAARGPDERKIRDILERTGYALDVTTGQRKYGGPPPEWEGEAPGNGCEVRLSVIMWS